MRPMRRPQRRGSRRTSTGRVNARWRPGSPNKALAFGTTASHFLAGAALGGVGRALLSGPLESWYVDTVRTVDPTVALRPGLARAGFAEGIALALGALLSAVLPTVGAGLPLDGPVSQLTLPAYGGMAAEVASFVAVLVFVREPAVPPAVTGVPPPAPCRRWWPAVCARPAAPATCGACSVRSC